MFIKERFGALLQNIYANSSSQLNYFFSKQAVLRSFIYEIFSLLFSLATLPFSYLLGRVNKLEEKNPQQLKILQLAQAIFAIKPQKQAQGKCKADTSLPPELPQLSAKLFTTHSLILTSTEKALLTKLIENKLQDSDLENLKTRTRQLSFSDGKALAIDGFLQRGLIEASPFFKGLLEGGFKEELQASILIPNLSSTDFKWLIYYLYKPEPLLLSEACYILRFFNSLLLRSLNERCETTLISYINKQMLSDKEDLISSEKILRNFQANADQISDLLLMAAELNLIAIQKACQNFFYACAEQALSSGESDFASFIKKFNSLPINLTSLDLSFIDSSHFKRLENFENLENLKLKKINPLREQNFNFPYLPQLKKLTVNNYAALTSKMLIDLIDKCPNLLALKLLSCYELNNELMTAIGRLACLEELTLGATNSFEMKLLKNCVNLRVLDLTDTTKLTNDNLAFISQLPNLEYLNIANTSVTDEQVAYLKDCQKLHTLNLLACHQLTEKVLPFLANLPQLKNISLTIGEKCITIGQISEFRNL